MNRAANVTAQMPLSAQPSLDMEALRRARVQTEPFSYLIVRGFVRAQALPAIGADFPVIAHAGSFPLSTLSYGPAFGALVSDLEGSELAAIVAEKLKMTLDNCPTMIPVRGQSRPADGKIH